MTIQIEAHVTEDDLCGSHRPAAMLQKRLIMSILSTILAVGTSAAEERE